MTPGVVGCGGLRILLNPCTPRRSPRGLYGSQADVPDTVFAKPEKVKLLSAEVPMWAPNPAKMDTAAVSGFVNATLNSRTRWVLGMRVGALDPEQGRVVPAHLESLPPPTDGGVDGAAGRDSPTVFVRFVGALAPTRVKLADVQPHAAMRDLTREVVMHKVRAT